MALAVGFEQMRPGRHRRALGRPDEPLRGVRRGPHRSQGDDETRRFAAQFFGGAGRAYAEEYGTAAGDVRPDRGQGTSPRGEQPLRGLPRPADGRAGARLAAASTARSPGSSAARRPAAPPRPFSPRGSTRAAHGLDRTCGSPPRPSPATPRLTFDGDMRRLVGYDTAAAAAAAGLRGSRRLPHATSPSSSCTTASPPTSCSATRRSASPRRAPRRSSSSTVTTPTAAAWSPTPPAACCPRDIRSGPTGLAQCAELTWQLRGEAGARQVEGATLGAAAQPRPRRRLRRHAVRAVPDDPSTDRGPRSEPSHSR